MTAILRSLAVLFAATITFAVANGSIRLALAAPAALALLLSTLWLTRQALPPRRVLFTGAALSAALAVLAALLLVLPFSPAAGGIDADWGLGRLLTRLCLMWSVVLSCWSGPDPAPFGWSRHGRTLLAVVLGFGIVVMLWQEGTVRGHQTLSVDENIYRFQALQLLLGRTGLPVDDATERFLTLRQMFVRDGTLYGQYPVGWPLVLVPLRAVGIEEWATRGIHVLIVLAVWRLARLRGASTQAALLAASLTVCSYGFLRVMTSHYAHGITALFALAGAMTLARAVSGAARPMVWYALGGLAIGAAVAARPLTGVALGIAIVAWLWPRGESLRQAAGRLLAMAGGGLAPLAIILWYNAATTGHPTVFGYDVAHDGLQALGFGLRGQITRQASGLPSPESWAYTPALAPAQTIAFGLRALLSFHPGLLVIPVVAGALATGLRISWWRALVFLLLPVAHVFYFFPNQRFVIEAVPFLAIGVAQLVEQLQRAGSGPSWRAAWATVVMGMGTSLGAIAPDRAEWAPLRSLFPVVEAARLHHDKLLVLVADSSTGGAGNISLAALYWYNAVMPDRVIVGRDIPELRATFLTRYSDYVPYRLAEDNGARFHGKPRAPRLTPLERPAPETGMPP